MTDGELARILGSDEWEPLVRALRPEEKERLFVLASKERLGLEAKGHAVGDAERKRLQRLREICDQVSRDLAKP